MADFQTIKVEREEDGIVTVTLNRPQKRNAMSPRLHYEMCKALDQLAEETIFE